MSILFVQLPVPTLVAQRNIGNHLLASSSLYLHLKHLHLSTEQIKALPQELCSRGGDQVTIDAICKCTPDIVAFTCAVWNIERTLYMCKAIKSVLPDVLIWLGGPEIASDSYFIREYQNTFDLAVEGEGEEIFRMLVQGIDPSSLDKVFLPGRTKSSSSRHIHLIDSLKTIHDPFMQGFARMEHDRVIVTELFRGCKYGCLFCKYHDGSKNGACSVRPYEQISELFDWARHHGTKEFFLLDPSFEQRPDIDTFLEFLAKINKHPAIPIFAELRAEYVDETFARNLRNAGILHVETGLQTINRNALRKAGRTFNRENFVNGIRNLQHEQIKIRADIMLGLPGDSPGGLKDTAKFLSDLNINSSAQVFKTQVLPGTILRKAASQFGIIYEERPPYQIISTPQWSESELRESLFEAESLLGINLSPEERPHIILGDQKKPVIRNFYTDATVVYALYFDSTTESGRINIANEKFADTGFVFSLIININSLAHVNLIRSMLSKMVNTNPFSTITVGVRIPPLFPLDIFDIVESILSENEVSDYVPKLFPTTYSRRPHRRLLACLELKTMEKYSESWLEELRSICEVVWIADSVWCVKILKSTDCPLISPVDYIYIDIVEFKTVCAGNFEELHQSRYADQLLFSDLEFQWDFIEN